MLMAMSRPAIVADSFMADLHCAVGTRWAILHEALFRKEGAYCRRCDIRRVRQSIPHIVRER
jgi:hypothetical protein